MLSKKIIWGRVRNKKSIRGIDPFQVRAKDLDTVVDVVIQECKTVVFNKSAPEFDPPWASRRTMRKHHIKRSFKPIPKLDRITQGVFNNLKESFHIELRHTINKGPEYTYFTSKKDNYRGDWVCVPEPDRFKESKYYYKTLLHELSHAACSRTRLCLKLKDDEEEVAVEASALIICFLSGYNLWQSCLGYMINWSYGSAKRKKDHILYLNRQSQWDSIQSKTKRIVRYLLNSTN
jgi:hypothetical protein